MKALILQPLADASGSSVPGAGFIVLAVALILIGLGVPLYVLIGGLVFTCYAVWPEFGDVFGEHFSENFDRTGEMVDLVDTPELVAIPFFMVAGALMGKGVIARKLIGVATAWLGWLPGGLGIAAIFACAFFAAISGSSPVTVVTIGSVMIPALRAAGYNNTHRYGLVTAAGGLGIIIPPSIPMVVYAIYASNSGVPVKVEELFMAGLLPGLFIAVVLSLFTGVGARKAERVPFELRKALAAMADGVWALFLPVFILGGIYLGVFNAIESAAISVVLAVVIEVVIHRSLKWSEIPQLMADNALLMGAILLIITTATGFSSFVEDRQMPELLGEWLRSVDLGPAMFILVLNLVLLMVGFFLDIISAIVLFVPLVIPLANELGFDPLHMGIIFIVNLEIGYLTPPIGLNLFVATSYFKQPFGLIVRSVAPFVLVMLVCLGVLTYVPAISTGLPHAQRGQAFWSDFPDERAPAAAGADGEAGGAGEGGPQAPATKAEESMQEMMQDPEIMRIMQEGGMQPAGEAAPAPATPTGDAAPSPATPSPTGTAPAAPAIPGGGPATDEFDAPADDELDEE
jgi:C4-dicarboxylate transporter DctM subunit